MFYGGDADSVWSCVVTGDHRGPWGQKQLLLLSGLSASCGLGSPCCLGREETWRSFILHSVKHTPTHPSSAIHPPSTIHPSIHPFVLHSPSIHPSRWSLSTCCVQTLCQAASRTSEARSDMAWCWDEDSMTEHMLCVQPHLTPWRPSVADATSTPTLQTRKPRLR